ncbi:MAG: UvrB/UvrC motif-containing protein [Phycisphaerales bacterium]|nr:UvrB/UvrC motif-containing protein [Phycisphaerales bacterium]
MKCDLCDKPAVVHEVSINNGVKKEVHLCLEHAQAAGLSIPGQQPINQLLKKFVVGQASAPEAKRCARCGSTFAQIRQTNLIGCPDCYTTFHEPISSLIEQAQFGATAHVGRVPNQLHTPTQVELRTRKLLKELDAAVTAEQYERAADLRDRLNKLSTELPNEDAGSGDAS